MILESDDVRSEIVLKSENSILSLFLYKGFTSENFN
jgi:hypothetical protein